MKIQLIDIIDNLQADQTLVHWERVQALCDDLITIYGSAKAAHSVIAGIISFGAELYSRDTSAVNLGPIVLLRDTRDSLEDMIRDPIRAV